MSWLWRRVQGHFLTRLPDFLYLGSNKWLYKSFPSSPWLSWERRGARDGGQMEWGGAALSVPPAFSLPPSALFHPVCKGQFCYTLSRLESGGQMKMEHCCFLLFTTVMTFYFRSDTIVPGEDVRLAVRLRQSWGRMKCTWQWAFDFAAAGLVPEPKTLPVWRDPSSC